MSPRQLWKITLMVAAPLAVASPAAGAQTFHTWVSGVGNDANPCSLTAPCKTFAGAISKTLASGQIGCLDPADFGGVTITKAISIVCDQVVGGVLITSTSAIIINAATTDAVHLSGLNLKGQSFSQALQGLNGVSILKAQSVRIKNTFIHDFVTAGINVTPSAAGDAVKVEVIDSVIADNPGAGILVKPTSSASVRVTLERTRVNHNGGDGAAFDATATTGSVKGVVHESIFAGNGANGVAVLSSGAVDRVLIDESSAFDNATGLAAKGAGAIIRFSNSNVAGNGTGVSQTNSGVAQSFVTNHFLGNTADGSFASAPLK